MIDDGLSPIYHSTRRALAAVDGSLSPVLVPETTRVRLREFASRHPRLGQTQYLECRLGRDIAEDARAQVDLLISAATTFERTALRYALATSTDESAELAPLRRFVEAWSSPASQLYRAVPVAWLEFDHMERDSRPIGNVGVCLAPAYIDPFAVLPRQPTKEVLATIAEALRAICAGDASPNEVACLYRSVDRLPDGARWIHLSVMVARSPIELKLYGAFPSGTVVGFLRRSGWAGDLDLVARLLSRYCTPARTGGTVYIDLPVTGMGAPETAGLGLVFSQQQLRESAEHAPARPALLDALVADGLCTADERAALAHWPHDSRSDQGARSRDRVDRWLDLKIAHRPGGLLAKAYLGFVSRPGRVAEGFGRRARGNRPPAPYPSPAGSV